jgi:hypothetical protein
MRTIIVRIKVKEVWEYFKSKISSTSEEETAGQSIGKCDIHNKMIYDSDVVKFENKICLVIWDDKRCGFYLKLLDLRGYDRTDKYYKLSNKKLEILGNKFDNPELLKGE